LIAVQRAAGEAPCGTLKEQLRPSALLPAAAALVALIQNTNSAAAAISMISLMAIPPALQGRASVRANRHPPTQARRSLASRDR
jgi:hypothetical protein